MLKFRDIIGQVHPAYPGPDYACSCRFQKFNNPGIQWFIRQTSLKFVKLPFVHGDILKVLAQFGHIVMAVLCRSR